MEEMTFTELQQKMQLEKRRMECQVRFKECRGHLQHIQEFEIKLECRC